MIYTLYELAALYFIYSFIGWCAEVCIAVVHKRKFINRGFVSGPLCPIYGTGAVAFAVFLPDLKDSFFFLFLGGAILASFIEFITGVLLEKIFHKKWWNYSNIRFNFDGYICLRYSLLWGLFAVLLICFANPFLTSLFRMIPHLAGSIILWVLSALLLLDTVCTALALLGMQKKVKRFSAITDGMVLAKGCGFYKLVALFFIGAFLGDITETIFCLLTMHRLMSRSSVIYGPFSIVWGLGCMLLTAILYRMKDKSDFYIFIAGTVLGGAYEYVCSVFTELVFGTIFWDYSGFAFNLGGRINLLYCFFWGIAAVVWMKWIYPFLSRLIEKLPIRAGKILCNGLLVFMIFNCLLSSLALARYTQRNTQPAGEQQAVSVLDEFLDAHYTDERMERIYPNAKIVKP